MTDMTRRDLWRKCVLPTIMVPVGFALADCSAVSSIVSAAPAIASDAELIAQALQSILPTIETLTGLAGGAKNTISGIISQISGVAGQIATATTTTAQSLAQELGGLFGTLTGNLSGVGNLPGIVNQVLGDIFNLLPALGVSPPATARRFTAVLVTPDQARNDLQLILARPR